jgi:hypothetical protein
MFKKIPFATVKRDIGESLTEKFEMHTCFFETIADKVVFKYPELLHIFYCFSLKIVVAIRFSKKQQSYKKKQPKKEVNIEDPLIDTNNTNPEIITNMEIEVANEN